MERYHTMNYDRDFLANEKEIIIYGAGAYGVLVWKGLLQLGREPTYFMDRSKSGTSLKWEEKTVFVLNPVEIDDHNDAAYLIASKNYFADIKKLLKEQGIKKIYDITFFLDMVYPSGILSEQEKDLIFQKDKYKEVINNRIRSKGITLTHLEIAVTERCTLKCKDCANLMTYYEKSQDMDYNLFEDAMDKLLAVVDSVLEVRLLGGEPFLYPLLHKVLEYCRLQKKIKLISIYTNGTVIPNNRTMKALVGENISVHVSDYGIHDSSIEKLCKVFDTYHISFFLRKYDTWSQYGDMTCNLYTNQKLLELFSNCTTAFCMTLLHGKLYCCPRSAHAQNLGLVREKKYINLMAEGLEEEKLKEKLLELLNRKRYPEACRYCYGSMGKETIRPAVQSSK